MQIAIAPEGAIYDSVTIGRLDIVTEILDRAPEKLDSVGPLERTPLHKASQCGHIEIVRLLVERGANLQVRDGSQQSPLHLAAFRGREEVVDFLWPLAGSVKEWQDKSGNTLLHAAAKGGLTQFVQKLIDDHADVNHPNRDGATPLFVAAANGHSDIADTLIYNGARLGIITQQRQTLLHAAVEGGISPLVVRLLAEGADARSADLSGHTPLVLAARRGFSEIVSELLEHGAFPDLTDGTETSSLLKAACEGGCHSMLTRMLDDQTLSTALRRIPFATMLQGAVFNGRSNIVRTLVERGASVEDITLTYDCCKHGAESVEILRTLIEAGADVNACDAEGQYPIHHAAFRGDQELIELLLSAGAKADGSALVSAIWAGNANVVRLFVEMGLEPDSQGDSGQTALLEASQTGNLEMVDLLLELGASTDASDDLGFSPLHHAVAGGHIEIVQSLIMAGADPLKANAQGIQPLHCLPVGAEIVTGTREEERKFAPGVSLEILELLESEGAERDPFVAAGIGDRGFLEKHLTTDPNCINDTLHTSGTMLHWATRGGQTDVIDFLLSRKIDVNAVDINGKSALHWAAYMGRDHVGKRLIECGAEVCLADSCGETPLDVAARKCQRDFSRLLESHGATRAPTPLERIEAFTSEIADSTFESLDDAVGMCTLCDELVHRRERTVFGRGGRSADLVFLGPAPTEEDETTGLPFCGSAGNLLDKIIKACALSEEDVYVTNLIKCVPENAQFPTSKWCYNCRAILDRQLTLLAPKVICCLGDWTANRLLNTNLGWAQLRGTTHAYLGRPVVVTHDLRRILKMSSKRFQANMKRQVWEDCKLILRLLGRDVPNSK